MRAATASVGLVSPRSTWESIGAETPERSARSRSESDSPRGGRGCGGRAWPGRADGAGRGRLPLYERTLSRTAHRLAPALASLHGTPGRDPGRAGRLRAARDGARGRRRGPPADPPVRAGHGPRGRRPCGEQRRRRRRRRHRRQGRPPAAGIDWATDHSTPVSRDATYGAGIVDAAAAVAGLGGTSSGPGAGRDAAARGRPATRARLRDHRHHDRARISRRGLLRRGLPVRRRAAGIGTCGVTAHYGRIPVARGAGAVTLTKPALVRAVVTGAGRRVLARQRHSVRLKLFVRCPGITPKNAHVVVGSG